MDDSRGASPTRRPPDISKVLCPDTINFMDKCGQTLVKSLQANCKPVARENTTKTELVRNYNLKIIVLPDFSANTLAARNLSATK